MVKKNQPSESPLPESDTISENSDVLNDPAMDGLKDNKQYTHFNANIITDSPGGVIPEIPEPNTRPIDVDFTNKTTHADSEYADFMASPDDLESGAGKDTEDIADDTKVDLAVVVNQLLFTGLDVLNDFIAVKLIITEGKLNELAMTGEIPFEIINVRVQFSPIFLFDMAEFLKENEAKTRKALEFKPSEKKHISELLEKALKSKKLKLSPEWAIVMSLVGHYTASMYQLFINNAEVMKMVNLLSERYSAEREAASEQMRQSAKRQSAAKKPAPEKPASEQAPEASDSTTETPIKEYREPGEQSPTVTEQSVKTRRNKKRSLSLADIQEAQIA